eukprot:g22602.t1
MKSAKKKDVWGSFRAGEAEPLSDSEATKPKQGKKKKTDSKKPAGPTGPNLARKRVADSKVSGVVESWTNSYGWIRPFHHVSHPKAGKHGGKIYIHGKDVKGGMGFLPVGGSVEFYVFEDDAGLGAEECVLTEKGKGSKGGKGWGWDSKGGGKGKGASKGGKGESGGKDRKGKDSKESSKGKSKGSSGLEVKPGSSETPEVVSDWSGYTGLSGGQGSQAHVDTSRDLAPEHGTTQCNRLARWRGHDARQDCWRESFLTLLGLLVRYGIACVARGETWSSAIFVPCLIFVCRGFDKLPVPRMGGVGTAPVPAINSVPVNQMPYQYGQMMPGFGNEKFSILPRLANIFDATVSKRVQVTRFIDYAPMVFQLGPYLE